MQGNPRQSWIQDSTPQIPDSRNWIPDIFFVELGFHIPIVSGIPDSTTKICWMTESRLPYMGRVVLLPSSSPGPGSFSQRPEDEVGSVS